MCLMFFLLVFEAEKWVLLCGAAGAGAGGRRDLGFGFHGVVGFPAPIGWPGASQSIYTQ